jgi:sulfite reductase alpha subunit-like flavoprotein
MAKDVRATLVHAALAPEAAERAVAELERNKRYLLDVY